MAFIDVAHAASGAEGIIDKISANVVSPIIWVLFAAAFVYFIWGVLMYVKNADSEDARTKGRWHIFWGVIGMAIMFGAKALVYIIRDTVGN